MELVGTVESSTSTVSRAVGGLVIASWVDMGCHSKLDVGFQSHSELSVE